MLRCAIEEEKVESFSIEILLYLKSCFFGAKIQVTSQKISLLMILRKFLLTVFTIKVVSTVGIWLPETYRVYDEHPLAGWDIQYRATASQSSYLLKNTIILCEKYLQYPVNTTYNKHLTSGLFNSWIIQCSDWTFGKNSDKIVQYSDAFRIRDHSYNGLVLTILIQD